MLTAVKCRTQEVKEMNASIEEGKCGGKGEGMAGRGGEERVEERREVMKLGTEVDVLLVGGGGDELEMEKKR